MRKTKRTAIALLAAVATLFTLFLASCTKPVDAAKTMIEQITNPDSQTAYTVEMTITYTLRNPEDPSITKQEKQNWLMLVKGKEVHSKYNTDNGDPEYLGIVSVGSKYYGYDYKGEDGANAEYFEISNDSIDGRVLQLCPIVPLLPVLKQLFPDGFEEKDGVFVLKEESYLGFYRISSGDTEATEIPEEYKADIIKGAENFSLEVEKDSFTIHNNMTMREGANGTMVAKVSNVGTTEFKPFHALTLPIDPDTPQTTKAKISSILKTVTKTDTIYTFESWFESVELKCYFKGNEFHGEGTSDTLGAFYTGLVYLDTGTYPSGYYMYLTEQGVFKDPELVAAANAENLQEQLDTWFDNAIPPLTMLRQFASCFDEFFIENEAGKCKIIEGKYREVYYALTGRTDLDSETELYMSKYAFRLDGDKLSFIWEKPSGTETYFTVSNVGTTEFKPFRTPPFLA